MSDPVVSVVMASYNHERYVMQAVDSVLGQAGVDFEFLIEDDGSKDGTAALLAGIEDPRVTFYPKKTNEGQSVTVNALIRRARGEFIAIINSDDVWTRPDKLALQVELLRSRPEVGVSFGRVQFVDGSGAVIPEENVTEPHIFDQPNRSRGEWLRRFFLEGNCLCHPSAVVRRSCHEQFGLYDTRLRQIPDLPLWTRIVKRYDLWVHEEQMVSFRLVSGENASAPTVTNSRRLLNEQMLTLEEFFDGADADLLRAGFPDLLVNPGPMTPEELEVEKALLFFRVEKSGPVCWMVGLRKMFHLLGDPRYREALSNYGISERWFHERMAFYSPFIDPPPALSAEPAEPPPLPTPGSLSKSRQVPLLRYLSFLRR